MIDTIVLGSVEFLKMAEKLGMITPKVVMKRINGLAIAIDDFFAQLLLWMAVTK